MGRVADGGIAHYGQHIYLMEHGGATCVYPRMLMIKPGKSILRTFVLLALAGTAQCVSAQTVMASLMLVAVIFGLLARGADTRRLLLMPD